MEPNRQQYDRSVTFVIAQQYSSATFISKPFLSQNSPRLKCYYFNFFFIAYVRNRGPSKLNTAGSSCKCMSVHVANMDRAALPLEPTSPSHRVVSAYLISLTLTPFLPHKRLIYNCTWRIACMWLLLRIPNWGDKPVEWQWMSWFNAKVTSLCYMQV